MAIGDFFRPKYKHSKSEVRAAAVAAMDTDDIDLLIEIASKDTDLAIRRTAIDKISDPETLAGLADSQDDSKLRDYANSLALDIWVGKAVNADDEIVAEENFLLAAKHGGELVVARIAGESKHSSVRRLALSKIDDDKALAQVVRKAQRMEEWQLALERIGDETILRSIAIDETRKQVAFAALERITDGDLLDEIASKAKAKPVRAKAKRAKAVIVKAKPLQSKISDSEKQDRAERSQLVRTIESFVGGDEWVDSRGVVDEAVARWEELGQGDKAKLIARFDKALSRYNKNHEQYGRAAEEAVRRAAEEALREERKAVEKAEAAVLAAQAEAAGETSEAGSDESSDLPADNDGNTSDSSGDTSDSSGEAAIVAKPTPGDDRDSERRLDNQDDMERLCEGLEELLEIKDIRNVDRTLKEIDRGRRKVGTLPKNVEETLRTRYDEARKKAVIYLGDLREADDWKRWTTVPKMEELVKIAKELLAAEEIPNTGEILKKLQRAWRELGPAPREKADELWKDFKATCDEVYERVKVQRDARDIEQTANLEKKEALCVRAEELQSSEDWAATGELFKELQTEWKTIGPVPRRKSDGQWKRFRAACDAFFEARAPHLEERFAEEADNLEAKEALVKEVETLAATEVGLEEIEGQIQQVRDMQRRWRDIGKVAHKEFTAVGDAYKKACDEVYGKREAITEAAREAARVIVTELEKRIVECSDAGWDSDAEDIAKQVLEIRSSYKEMDSQSEGYEALGVKVDTLIRAQLESEPAAYAGSELDPKRSAEARAKLIEQAEELLPPVEDSDAQSAEEMAESLRAALADRALGGIMSKTGGRSIPEMVAALRADWAEIPPVPGAPGTAAEQRFATLCDTLLAAESSDS
ncbi:MAG: DUF349 domain-containing protein [Kofleriaceae bacterium]|nr:DUF349 domain-containing protein [Kofleriaceae bacterium]